MDQIKDYGQAVAQAMAEMSPEQIAALYLQVEAEAGASIEEFGKAAAAYAEASRAQMIEGEINAPRKRRKPSDKIVELLQRLSLAELEEMTQRIARMVEQKRGASADEVRRRLIESAQADGFDARELLGVTRKRVTFAGHLQPKYRELGGGGRTWVGRGKLPHWFRLAISAGVTREEMLIPVGA